MPDQNDLSERSSVWHRTVEATLNEHCANDMTFELIESDSQLAVIIQQCCFNAANTLVRLVRNSLMRKFPLRKPSIAVRLIESRTLYDAEFNADKLLAELCSEIGQNAAKKSSRIEVKRFKLKA